MRPDQKMMERMLSSSGINPCLIETLKELKKVESKSKPAESAGWHNADEILTLDGLEGKFLWAEHPFDVRIILFTFNDETVGYEGHYHIFTNAYTPPGETAMVLEKGTFYCCPNNPAIGWAALTLAPQQSQNIRAFTVDGMMMVDSDLIEVLLLKKLGENGPVSPAFSATRLSM